MTDGFEVVTMARDIRAKSRILDFAEQQEFKREFQELLADYILCDDPENNPPSGYEQKQADRKLTDWLIANIRPIPGDERGKDLYEIDGNKFWLVDGKLSAHCFNQQMDIMFEAFGYYRDAVASQK